MNGTKEVRVVLDRKEGKGEGVNKLHHRVCVCTDNKILCLYLYFKYKNLYLNLNYVEGSTF